MNYNELVTAIINGSFDEKLENFKTIIREREKIIDQQNATIFKTTIKVGTIVRLKNIRPKYLVGQTATVTNMKVNNNRIEVKLNKMIGRFGGFPFTCPINCLEVEK